MARWTSLLLVMGCVACSSESAKSDAQGMVGVDIVLAGNDLGHDASRDQGRDTSGTDHSSTLDHAAADQGGPSDGGSPDLSVAQDGGRDAGGIDAIVPGIDVGPTDAGPSWHSLTGGAPPPRWGHAIAVDEMRQDVYLFGGSGFTGRVGDLRRFSLTGQGWDAPTTMNGPGARNNSTAVYDGPRDRILFLGGDKGSITNEVWALALSDLTWSQPAPLPAALASVSAVVVGDALYVFGGRSSASVVTGTLYSYDLVGNSWQPVTPLTATVPEARQRALLAFSNATLFLTGGDDTTAAVNTAYTFDPATTSWSPLTTSGSPAALRDTSPTVDVQCNTALLVGGRDGSGGEVGAVTHFPLVTSPTYDTLSTANSLPARFQTGAAFDPTSRKLFVFGGRQGGSGILADTYIVQLPPCP